jgi:hypothetical protein
MEFSVRLITGPSRRELRWSLTQRERQSQMMTEQELCEYKDKVNTLLRRVSITYLSDEQITKLAEAWFRQEKGKGK